MKADAVIVKAINLRAGMDVCPLHSVASSGFSRLTDPPESHSGGYVNLRFQSGGYSTPSSTLYVVLR